MPRYQLFLAILFSSSVAFATTTQPATTQPLDPRFTIGKLLYTDDFQSNTQNWIPELESGGNVTPANNQLDINAPAGATIWFKPLLQGPILIQYEATAIKANGPNDRVSDLNCFWMARDSRNPADIFAVKRSGKFPDYNQLQTYYVGQGGNTNTTTRFRRYIGDPILRPLLPQYDLHDPEDLLTPNTPQLTQLVACDKIIQYYRNNKRLFDFQDDHPYTSGWFAFRTTQSHLQIQHFRVYSLTQTETQN